MPGFRVLIVAVCGIAALCPRFGRGEWLDDKKVRSSVVKISATFRGPDVFRPWTKASPQEATGSGVVVAGKRILTNAHMVKYAAQVFVQPEGSGEKLPASVQALAPGIDLALLSLDDESFFDAHPALPVRQKLPGLRQTVLAYGYPEGGTELSVTQGIVSRIEYADYQYLTDGLRIQVDAAINPGNSGGPAVIDGEMIGLVFSKLSAADNIGYIIPMEEIELFFNDLKDGHYDGKPVFIDEVQTIENAALREKLKLESKTTGILVRKVAPRSAPYPLERGDVITRIGEYAVDNLGMVQLERDRLVRFQYLIERLAKDNRVAMTVIREGREIKCDVPVGQEHNRWLISYLDGKYPSYFIYGPLVFTEASDEYVQAFTAGSGAGASVVMSGLYSGSAMFMRYGDRPAFPGERLVILAHPLFAHRISKGYKTPYTSALLEVNRVRIQNLKHLVEVLRDATDPFVEFKFDGKGSDTIVLNRKEAQDATEAVLNDNGIRERCSADFAPVWNQAKKTK
jgi:S1-C subfamily serine protease